MLIMDTHPTQIINIIWVGRNIIINEQNSNKTVKLQNYIQYILLSNI